MSYAPPKSTGKDPQIQRKSINEWGFGVTTFNDARIPMNGLKSGGNLYLTQNNSIRPRPSTVLYGPQPLGTVLGEIFEYKKVTGLATEKWMISMQSFGVSRSPSASISPSTSVSPSASTSLSPSASTSPSSSISPSSSLSPSSSFSASISPSGSLSPSASASFSPSSSLSPSASLSPSTSVSPSSSSSPSRSPSASISPSASLSPSSSLSVSASVSPSSSISPSASRSPSASVSMSPSASLSPSASRSPSASISASPSPPVTEYAQIFIARGEDTTWTPVSGKYYSSTARAHYFQIGGAVVITNGSDYLSYLDIATATVIPFTALSTPSAPTLTTNNVGGTGFNVYYRITANSTVGETAASNALTVPVDTDRDLWNPPSAGGTDNVIIGWSAVASAVSYNVYMGTVSGFEFLIASGVNATTFTDDGTFVQDTTRPYPTTDSTAGPRATRGVNIGGRAFLVGDADHPYYVWNGGDPGHELDFSPANGGGWSLVGSGSKDLPVAVKSFRDGKGTPQITVLCEGTNGAGKRYLLTPDQLTYGNNVYTFYDVTEDSGSDGTSSPDAVIQYGTDLHYASRDGFKTTGTIPQVQNVLSTRRTTNTIQERLKLLNQDAMDKACGMAFEGRLYYSLPVSSNSNSEIWVQDIDRKGAWMLPWSIAADWLWLYSDNDDGTTHFLALVDNQVVEFSHSTLTQDNGEAFSTIGSSGQIFFSEDKRMWVQLLQVIFVVLGPQGTITFEVSGKTEDENITPLGEPYTFRPDAQTSVAGWGEPNKYVPGWGQNDWSQVGDTPTSITDDTQEVPVEIDEEVQWVSYSWSSTGVGTDYQLSDVIFEYIETGIKDLQ